MASEVAAAAANAVRRTAKEMHGIVVSAGLMDKTVKVRLGGLRWEPRVQKVNNTIPNSTYLPVKVGANFSKISSGSKSRDSSSSTTRATRSAKATS